MNYVGIDIHKRYSVLCAQDEAGRKLNEAWIEGDGAKGVRDIGGREREREGHGVGDVGSHDAGGGEYEGIRERPPP